MTTSVPYYSFNHIVDFQWFASPHSGTFSRTRLLPEWWERLTDHEAALEFSIGEGDNNWDLPRLSELLVHMREILIRIHPDVISRFPRLSRIFLVDWREEYRLDEVVRWTPTELPLLKELVLKGTPAISFHPDILHSATNLRDLGLEMFTSGADVTFIPPAEELDCADDDNNKNNDSLSTYGSVPRKQPTWTWDWHLLNLLSLKLNAEFGYRFKFRMLAGTPNLVRFIVGIGSQSGQHKRTIGIADLIKPGYQRLAMDRFLDQELQRQRWTLERQHVVGDIDNSSPIELEGNEDKFLKDFEYVHVPALKYFTLTGPWSLDRRVLEVLFGKVAPGVHDLIMSSEGHNVSEWVKATSEHLHAIESAHLLVDGVTAESLSKMGMKPVRWRNTDGIYSFVEPPARRTVPNPAQYQFNPWF